MSEADGGAPVGALRRLRERGATMVEGAIVMLPFFTMILGLLEGSLLLGDSLATAHTAKAGARTASALGTDNLTDYQVLVTIAREGRALRRSDINFIVIYDATEYGAEPSATCRAGTGVAGVCNVYVAADLNRPSSQFGCQSATALDGFWCPATRKTALTVESGGPPDFVGVWVSTTHHMVSGLVGTERVLEERSVLRIEPRRK
jgi:Flp pilus assembly protein TadG